MIGCITLGTDGPGRAKAFHDALLAGMGVTRLMEFGGRGYGCSQLRPKKSFKPTPLRGVIKASQEGSLASAANRYRSTQALSPMKKLLAAVIVLVVPMACAAYGQSPSAETILSQINKKGGGKVVSELFGREGSLGLLVLTSIETGDATWLNVAVQLLPFADGGTSLSIHYSVARAIPKAPEAVLAYARHGLDIEDVCTSPFIEPEPGVAEAYEREALAALANVRDPALVPVAAECSLLVRQPDAA